MPKIVLFKLGELASTAAAGVNVTETALNNKAIVANLALAARSVQSVGGMCVDNSGNIYVSDEEQHVIMKVNESGTINTLAGVAGSSGNNTALQNVAPATARFNTPKGMACDNTGNLYVADYGNNQIRKIDSQGRVSVLAGNGATTSGLVDSTSNPLQARFSHPSDVAVDASGVIYVSDTDNHAIRKIYNGQVLTIAGGSSSADAANVRASQYIPFCSSPVGIAVDRKGNIFVCDTGNRQIKKITPKGWIYRHSGSGNAGHGLALTSTEPAYECEYNTLNYIACDNYGYQYVIDYDSGGHSRLVKVDPKGVPSNVVDLNEATSSYAGIEGVAVSPAGKVFVSITLPTEPGSSSSSSSVDSSSSSSQSSESSSSSSSVDSSSSSSGV